MLGGGYFTTQNKVLPGTYHNFISKDRAFLNLADRGFAALPMALNWGKDGEVITVTAEDFQKDSFSIFGYEYTAPKLKGIRDVFKGASTVFFYKLTGVGATEAENPYAKALYTGTRGNDVTVVIRANVDVPAEFDVITLLGGVEVDSQTVAAAADLKANAFVTFTDAPLVITAGEPLVGGTNGAEATGLQHQEALDNLEGYGYNVLGCLSDDPLIKSLYVEYEKRLREQVGQKFQVVVHDAVKPDYEGVINVLNDAVGVDEEVFGAVYWVTGKCAGVAVNRSNTNATYTGEHTLDMTKTKTQPQLVEAIRSGFYVFHRVNDDIRVLEDINSFVSFTTEKNGDFSLNQVVRVLDQIAIDTAQIFNNRYLGKVPNDSDGRISFWNDVVKHRAELQNIRAIQNFDPKLVVVTAGEAKNAVVLKEEIEVSVAMSKLYATTIVA